MVMAAKKQSYSKKKNYKPTKQEIINEGEWIKGTPMNFEKMELMHNNWVNETNSDENKLKNKRHQNQKYLPIIKPKDKK